MFYSLISVDFKSSILTTVKRSLRKIALLETGNTFISAEI